MKKFFLILSFVFFSDTPLAFDEITPHKFTDPDSGLPVYDIPASSRFTAHRLEPGAPDLVYYFSRPKDAVFPISIVCGGSSSEETIVSCIHFHRYFLQEFLDLGMAVLTVEQRGVDGKNVDRKEFIEHYTRSARLQDLRGVISHLKSNTPTGWNGKFVFLGVSEGGPLVTSLTTEYADKALATMNWSGASGWTWREELWVFLQKLWMENPECLGKNWATRGGYDAHMDYILQRPGVEKFLNMTHRYWADALTYPRPEYQKIRTPFLVVTGGLDSLLPSSDAFVENAQKAGASVTYLRVADMDHFVRHRPDIIQQSFDWLCAALARGG